MTDWTFLNYGQEPEARNQRKLVRAHVTRRQHAKARLNQQSYSKAQRSVRGTARWHCCASCMRTCPPAYSSTSNRSFGQENPIFAECPSYFSTSKPIVFAQNMIYWTSYAGTDCNFAGDPHPKDTDELSQTDRLDVSGPTKAPRSIDLNVAPVSQKRWYGWLHDYWFGRTLPGANSRLNMSEGQLQQYIAWTRNLQCTEPAMYYMSLLLATGIPVANGQFPIVKALWLRGQTAAAINEALADPHRATSDALIQAVGFLALHEHIYGDRVSAHFTHRPAQQRMIAMRGGMEQLNLPTEVKQIMVWSDRLMSAESGTTPYFSALIDGCCIKPYSDPDAIAVTNNASPLRHKHPGYGIS